MASHDPDCLFCKMVAGTIPVKRLHDDDQSLAFADVNPQAPTHLLIIPKQHVSSLSDAVTEDTPLLGHLMAVTTELARTHSLKNGYRIVINTGADSGQSVHHLHLHLLGGRHMTWPPG